MTTQLIEFRFGRNINGTPMPLDRWTQFQAEARAILDGVATGLQAGLEPFKQWTEVHTGTGTWTNEDGSIESEDSAVVTLYTSASTLYTFTLRDTLIDFAAELAADYEQDAVALVVDGESTLVEPDELCDHEYESYCPNCGIDSEGMNA